MAAQIVDMPTPTRRLPMVVPNPCRNAPRPPSAAHVDIESWLHKEATETTDLDDASFVRAKHERIGPGFAPVDLVRRAHLDACPVATFVHIHATSDRCNDRLPGFGSPGQHYGGSESSVGPHVATCADDRPAMSDEIKRGSLVPTPAQRAHQASLREAFRVRRHFERGDDVWRHCPVTPRPVWNAFTDGMRHGQLPRAAVAPGAS